LIGGLTDFFRCCLYIQAMGSASDWNPF